MSFVEHLPAILIMNLFIFAFAMPLIHKWNRNWATIVSLFSLVLSFSISVIILIEVINNGAISYYLGGWEPPFGIEFYIDYLSSYMLIVLTGMGLIIFYYGLDNLPFELKGEIVGWYYTLYLLLIGAMLGMAITNDLFNLFVFMEISAIASCAIISVKKDRECLEASFKYLILSAMGTGCYLLAIALIYMITGYLNYDMVQAALVEQMAVYPNNVLAALSLIAVCFCVKAALFPLHVWLPDAHASAPSTSSAMLSGLVIKIYAIALIHLMFRVFPLEIFYEVPLKEILLWLGVLGMILGSIFAMTQENFKRMLAYSTVAQIGYVFLGIGLFNQTALVGGLLHILNHAVMKSILFMVAGIILYTKGLKKVREFDGIGNQLQWTMTAFIIASASMVGIPITGGFISKWYLATGAFEAERPFFIGVIILSSLLNAMYYFPIAIRAFLSEPKPENMVYRPVTKNMLIPVIILTALIFYVGMNPQGIVGILQNAVEVLFNQM